MPTLAKNNNEYDYDFYQDKVVDCLVPLEVVFRFGTPKGSSLLRRLEKDPKYAADLGLDKLPCEGDLFDHPIIEFSTKLEAADTYLTKAQACRYAGLSELEGARLMDLANLMALKLKQIYDSMGLELWDGKFEYGFIEGEAGQREFLWVDSLGPDEIRLLKDGAQLSKEYLRQVYEDSAWLNAVKMAKQEDKANFKNLVLEKFPSGPEKLSPEHKQTAEQIYQALTNELCQVFGEEKIFDCPGIAQVAEKIQRNNQ